MTLEKLLQKKGFTARSFAGLVGISEQMLSQIKKGKKPFPQDRIAAAVKILGVSEVDFLASLPTRDITISGRIPKEHYEILSKISPPHVHQIP